MNSERRHELQENELASALDKINAKIDPYSKPIAAVVAAGFIGMLAWGFYSTSKTEQRSEATYQLIEGSARNNSEVLAAIPAQYPKTPVAAWSLLYQGSQKMGVGINALFTNREEAEELLDEAGSAYRQAITQSDDKLIQSRAHFGLARIAESVGNTDEAIASYEAAMAAGESDAMVTEAKQRIESLSKPDTQEFLTWFNEQDFSSADPSLPPSLPSDQMLPDLPDLDFPEVEMTTETPTEDAASPAEEPEMTEPSNAEKSATEEPKGEEPVSEPVAEEQPTAEETKPEMNEEPAAEEPAAEEPAAEKPVEEKPAAEEPKAEEPVSEPVAEEQPMVEETKPEPTEEPAVEEKPAPEKPAEEPASDEEEAAVDLSAPSNS